MKQPFKITTLTAFVMTDGDGVEGILAIGKDGEWMPLVAADEARITSFRPYAESVARRCNRPVKLIRFSVREELETINHSAGGH
jgi:hypothetical protein